MLVLSRRVHEKILFPAIRASVQVVSCKAGVIRLGIQAPPEVTVLREEVQDRRAEWGPPADAAPAAALESRRLAELMRKRLQILTAGLELARQQLQDGLTQDAEATLREVGDDVLLLQERVVGEESRRPPSALKSLRALVVEDDCNERELLAGYLRLQGLEVDTAGDGTDALDYLRARGRPDVVLLDMGLPRCDGPTAVRAIRRNPELAGLKIFAVTGHLPEEFDLASGPTGVDRWFHKPIDPALLVKDLSQDLVCSLNRV
jgi:carbon storage regulator CsrA